jgi:hypothetical protein
VAINPLLRKIGGLFGYKPLPTPPPTPSYITPVTYPPPLNVGFYLFNGDTFEGQSHEYGATLGFRTQRGCGIGLLCPWSFDIDVDWTRSVFDSRFLGFQYRNFLNQIGFVHGMAGSVKATVGPLALIGEWNAAIENAKFRDDSGRRIDMRPRAWQASISYQFGWNSSGEAIGAQGTYLAFGYSESEDLEGVSRIIEETTDRVGFVPQRRFLASAGEWIVEGFRFAIEYSHSVDYPRREGGTGREAESIFGMFTYDW